MPKCYFFYVLVKYTYLKLNNKILTQFYTFLESDHKITKELNKKIC